MKRIGNHRMTRSDTLVFINSYDSRYQNDLSVLSIEDFNFYCIINFYCISFSLLSLLFSLWQYII